jgi:hypothetical protein
MAPSANTKTPGNRTPCYRDKIELKYRHKIELNNMAPTQKRQDKSNSIIATKSNLRIIVIFR